MSQFESTAKGRILRDLGGDLMDGDHSARRLFRCWLDGSYLGEDHYLANVDFISANNHNRKAMRRFIVGEFVKYTAHDADCSAGYAQSVIVNHFSTKFLEKLNNVLIDEAIEFGAEQGETV
tara:strand:+ start:604 stop:966 length:363 start_codon:yes stop_codon:yes gene_type:complete